MANWFVDQSATYNGNGTTAAQAASGGAAGAYNTFASVSPSAGDQVWIRRTSAVTLLTAARTLSVANVSYIGWPVSGDTFYASRPSSGSTAGWDADTVTYAVLECSTVLTANFFTITGAGTDLERLNINANYASATGNCGIVNVEANCTINNCWLLYQGLTTGSTASYGLYCATNSIVCSITNTTIEFNQALAGTGAHALLYTYSNGCDFQFINCIFTYSGAPTDTAINIISITPDSTAPTTTFADCTFTKTGTAAAGTLLLFSANSGYAHVASMYNCTINNSSTALSGDELDTPPGAGSMFIAQRLTCTNARRINIQTAGHYVHFATFTQGRASSDYAVQMVAGACFAANNFTETGGNTSGAINGTVASDILLQNTSFQSANPYGSSSPNAFIYEADSGGTYGNWKFTGRRGTVTASSVYRTGGEAFSLKFYMTTGSQDYLGFLQAVLNGLETIFASLTTTNVSVTIYGAYKGYSPVPDASQIWADCDYMDQASGAHRAFASSRGLPGTALGSDSSTWNGDTGLTPFKLVMSVAALQNCLAPIRLFDNLRQANAYFYIDPKPVVT